MTDDEAYRCVKQFIRGERESSLARDERPSCGKSHVFPYPREFILIDRNKLARRGGINCGADCLIRHFSDSFPIRGDLRLIGGPQIVELVPLESGLFSSPKGTACWSPAWNSARSTMPSRRSIWSICQKNGISRHERSFLPFEKRAGKSDNREIRLRNKISIRALDNEAGIQEDQRIQKGCFEIKFF